MNVKKIKKLLLAILSLLLIVSLYTPNFVYANVSISDNLEYKINDYYSVSDLTIKQQNNTYDFTFNHNGKNIIITSEFYKLLDAALFKGKAVGNILSSNSNILYFAISDEVSLLDKFSEPLSKNERILSVVILDKEDAEISNVNIVLTTEEFPILDVLLKESVMISCDSALYGELLHSQLWMKQYMPDNTAALKEFKQIDVYSPEISPSSAADDSYVASFVSYENLRTPAHAYGIKYNIANQPIGFYIRDTFMVGSSYITLLATFDISAEIASSRDNVTYQIQRAGNYFVEITPSNVQVTTPADDNSTYLVTKNPAIGIGIIGNQTSEYFSTSQVAMSRGGSSSSTTEFLNDTLIELIGKKYPLVSNVYSGINFFGSAMRALSDAVYQATLNQFELFAENRNNEYVKSISTLYEAPLYKKFSLLRIFATINNTTTSSSSINFQFRITCVGSQYLQDPSLDVNTTIDFIKPMY